MLSILFKYLRIKINYPTPREIKTFNWNRVNCIVYKAKYITFLLFFFFFLVGIRFEVRALHLQSRCSTTWAMPPVCFVLVILEKDLVNYLPELASNCDSPHLSLPRSQDYRYELPVPSFPTHFWHINIMFYNLKIP
jgi:hypothetical protein